MSKVLGVDQVEEYWNIDIDITKLASGISCSYICIIISYQSYVVSEFHREEWSTNGVCF
jgi:hypothetical protein